MKYENGQARRGPLILLLIAAIVSLLVYMEISAGIVTGAFGRTQKKLVPDGIAFEYASTGRSAFSIGKTGFLQATKDGASFFSFNGGMLWNITYSMQNPSIVQNGDNWALLDPGGRKVSVCGQDGLLYEVSTEYPILNAYLNEIPCLILVLQADESYIVRLYNAEGQISLERKSEIEGVYPLTAALTDDGMMFCIGYLDTSKAALSSRLLYFYTDSGAKRYGTNENAPYKAIEKPGEIITALAFNSENLLVGVTDSEIFITTVKGDELFSYELKNYLSDFSIGETMIAAALGEPVPNAANPLVPGSALVFSYEGETLAEYEPTIESIEIFGELILLKRSADYALTDSKGDEIWTYGAAADILSVLPIDKSRAVIAKAGSAELYSYKRPKNTGDNRQPDEEGGQGQ